MAVFTDDQMRFFDEQGYVILHDAAPAENLQAVIDAIAWFAGGPERERWYKPPYTASGIMQLFHHQALWDNRQHPRIYNAFRQIHGRDDLWVTMDRVCMKLPWHTDHPEYCHGGFSHWDADLTELPLRFGVQGVLALTDTTAEMGGFHCVPGIHKRLEAWVAGLSAEERKQLPRYSGSDMQHIDMKAGDLLIWHKGLAHGNGANKSDKPRLAQYISMFPPRLKDPAFLEQRLRAFETRGETTLGTEDRHWEQTHGKPPVLTDLGRKLLGVDSW